MKGRRDGTCGGKGANIVELGYHCVVRFDCRLISIPTYVFYFVRKLHLSTQQRVLLQACFAVLCMSVFLGGLVPWTFARSLSKREHFKTSTSQGYIPDGGQRGLWELRGHISQHQLGLQLLREPTEESLQACWMALHHSPSHSVQR